jgi:hypothetical protein
MGGPSEWDFTDDLSEAAVFNYLGGQVEKNIQAIQQSHGLELEIIHVASHDFSEKCDRCDLAVPPTLAVFTGRQFLCPNCSGSDSPMSCAAL